MDPIIHMVMFCLKHEHGSAEEAAFLRDGERILTGIPGVTHFRVLRQVSPKNDYDYGFSMEFKNREAYERYNAHPLHTAFVNDRWKPEVTRFLEMDFTVLV